MTSPQKVCLFSGGRTSGYMLRKLIDANPNYRDEFITCFCNTGKERNETLDFVHEVETRWDIPIVWLEYTRVPAASIKPGVFPTPRRNANLARAAAKGESAHWFKVVDYKTASRNGEPFNALLNWMTVLPNVTSRVCSVQLKMRTTFRYLFSIGVASYEPHIGIRKDEDHRSTEILSSCENFEFPKFPLIDLGATEETVFRFWKRQPFDLRLQSYEGNCDLCFLKAGWKKQKLIRDHPGMVDWWKNWEEKKFHLEGDGKYFRKGQSYAKLEKSAMIDGDQFLLLLKTSNDADIPCSCAEKSFGWKDEET